MRKIIAVLLTLFLVACLPMPAGPFDDSAKDNATGDEIVVEANKTEVGFKEVETPVEANLDDTIPTKLVTEGDLVSFPNLKATDPDGDPIEYTFSEPLDAKGEWLTKVGDIGEHLITITASDGENIVEQKIRVIVMPKNAPPIIKIADSIEVQEGEKIVLSPVVTDADNDEITITYSGFMTQKEYVTNFDEAGSHKVKITATDGQNVAEREIFIIVRNINRPPVIDPIEDIKITEGDKIIVTPTGMDPDGDKVKYSFSEPLDEAGKWKTNVGDAGTYEVTVTADDGETKGEITFEVFVEALNKAPVIQISDVTVEEGETVSLNPVISDPEGDEFSTTYSGWMNSNTKTTGHDDAGTYVVTITARDSAGNTAKKDVQVIVEDVNRPPVFDPNAFI